MTSVEREEREDWVQVEICGEEKGERDGERGREAEGERERETEKKERERRRRRRRKKKGGRGRGKGIKEGGGKITCKSIENVYQH